MKRHYTILVSCHFYATSA